MEPCRTGHDRLRASVLNLVRTTCFIAFRLHTMGVKKPDEDEMRHVSSSRSPRYRRWFFLEFGSRSRIHLLVRLKGRANWNGLLDESWEYGKDLSHSLEFRTTPRCCPLKTNGMSWMSVYSERKNPWKYRKSFGGNIEMVSRIHLRRKTLKSPFT